MKRMRLLTGFGLLCLVCLATLVGVAAPRAAEQVAQPATPTAVPPVQTSPAGAPGRPIDYNWDVRPILSDNCFRCHGPDEKSRQAGLRLDTAEGAYAALRRPGTFAVVPGKPAESQMIFRITHANAAVRMPPQVTNKVLTPQQIEILRAWIAQGAEYKPHWAFMPPQQAAAPAVPSGSVGPQRHRSVRAGTAQSRGADALAAGRQGNADQPRDADADRAAADTGGGGRVPEGQESAGVREARRSAARLDGVRRARGRAVARHRAVCGERRVPGRHARPAALAVSRLGDHGAEQEHAVRPVCDVAAGGRSAAEPHEGTVAGDGVPARWQANDRERRDRRGVSRRVCGRSGDRRSAPGSWR